MRAGATLGLVAAACWTVSCGCAQLPLTSPRIDSVASAQAGRPFNVQVSGPPGPCPAPTLTCQTAVHAADNTILLVVYASACGGVTAGSCPAPVANCLVQALPEGRYSFSINGAAPSYPLLLGR